MHTNRWGNGASCWALWYFPPVAQLRPFTLFIKIPRQSLCKGCGHSNHKLDFNQVLQHFPSGKTWQPVAGSSTTGAFRKAVKETTNKTPPNTFLWLDRETLISHMPSQVSQFNTETQRQKHFYITAQQSREKKNVTKPHLSLGLSFKSCFAAWWKVPSCMITVRLILCCMHSWTAEFHSHHTNFVQVIPFKNILT